MKRIHAYAKALAVAAPIAAFGYFGCSDNDSDVVNTQSPGEVATAEMHGYTDSLIRGAIVFSTQGDSLMVQGSISGLISGQVYGIHVHQSGNCSAPDSSGQHFGFGLEPHGNPFDSLGKHHRGDLPNVAANSGGVASIRFTTKALSLAAGDRLVAGSSVVLDARADDYLTQPDGNSDGRIACGIIGNGTPVKDTTGTTGGTPSHP